MWPFRKKNGNYVWLRVLANAKVVTILQYISVSNQHIVYLKLTQCIYKLYFNKAGGKGFLA